MLSITEINVKLLKLNRADRVVLELYAYFNGSRFIQTNDVLAAFHLPKKIFDESIKRLKSAGLLKEYFFSTDIESSYILPVLAFMAENYNDDARKMDALFLANKSSYYFITTEHDLYHALRYALGYEEKPSATLRYCDIHKYIMDIYEEPYFPRLIDCLSPLDQDSAICEIVDYATMTDKIIPQSRQDYIANNLINELVRNRALDLFAFYRFVSEGTRIEETSKETSPYRMMQLGVQAAVDGLYSEALVYFANSLKVLNKEMEVKNVFFFFVTQYFYTMCLIRDDSEASKKKLAQYLKKKDIGDYENQAVSLSLARSEVDGTHKPSDYSLERILRLKSNGELLKNCTLVGAMIGIYFGVMTTTSGNILRQPDAVPSLLLIRHETSKYLNLTAEQRAELSKLYGDNPILTSIKKKEEWEWVIDEVLRKVNAATQDNATKEKEERVIYVISHDKKVEMHLQTTLKSGRWSLPKKIAKKRIEAADLPNLQNCDLEYISAFKRANAYSYYIEWPSIFEVLPILADSGRVFKLDSYGYPEPVKFEEEKANLQIKRSKDGQYTVNSNLSLEDLKNLVANRCVDEDKKNTYTIIHVSDTAKAILENMLKIKTLPASAESNLRNMLTRIEDIVDVKSPLLDSKSVPTVNGSTMIHARITPSTGMQYRLNFEMRPLPEGSTYVYPGEGKAIIYDTEGDKTYRVKRNLKEETKEYSELIDDIGFIDPDVSDNGFSFMLPTEDILELMDYASTHTDRLSIEWAEGKGLSVARPATTAWNIGLKSNNDWFEVEGNVKLDENTVLSMTTVFDLLSQNKGKYIKLNDNEYLEINQKLRKQLDRIEALSVKNRNKTMISQFNAALIDDKALDGELKVAFDNKLAKLRKNVAETNNYQAEVPAQLQATLRPYQVEGYQWMARLAKWGAGACLADDMGLGKTVETIAFLLLKASEGPALVVAPASVVPNWVNEVSRFAPTLNTFILNKASDRKKLIEDMGAYDVVVSTYGILTTEEEVLAAKKWTTICLDEAHTIKNKETKMSHAVMSFTADYRVILTGTPIQNHLGELWNLFRFINPGLLGSDESFRRKFVMPIQNGEKDRQHMLQRIIKPFMLRRTKSEVVDDLPEKTEIVMPVELSDSELAMYEALRKKAADAIMESDKVDVNTLAEITKLRRAACCMELVEGNWTGPNSKVDTLVNLAEEIKGTTNRMLVFSQFTSFFAIVRKALDKAGIKYLYLDGSTSMKEREKLVKEFKEGDTPLFLISLKAGGLGLNLPDANYVVHLDPWWNPAIEQQATDRAYRIGQKRNVTVYHLISKNTIEEKIRRLHRTKRDLADSLLEGTDMASKLTIAEIMDMVKE